MPSYRTQLRSVLLLPIALFALVAALLVGTGTAKADGVNPCSKADEHALSDAQFVDHHCPGLYYQDYLFQYGAPGVYADVQQVEYCIKNGSYATGDQLLTVRATGAPVDPSLGVGDAEILDVTPQPNTPYSAVVTFEVPPNGGAIWYRVYCY